MGEQGEQYEGFLYPASKDVFAIEALCDNIDLHCEAICFHAQQAAEKMVKSVYAEHDEEPPRTHDIAYLLIQAGEKEWLAAPDSVMEAAARLTSFAVMARYEFSRDISGVEARLAIENCNQVAQLLENEGYRSISIKLAQDASE